MLKIIKNLNQIAENVKISVVHNSGIVNSKDHEQNGKMHPHLCKLLVSWQNY